MNNLISQRRSIFPAQFSKDEIAKHTIEKLIEAANWAPTHRKTEPWRFKVFQNRAKESLGEQLVQAYKITASKFSATKANKIAIKVDQSAAVIAICMQRDPEALVPEWEEIAATAMAVQNLWLCATDLGLGGYWSSPSFANQINTFLDLAAGERCLGFFYLGYYEGPAPQRQPSPWHDKVRWFE